MSSTRRVGRLAVGVTGASGVIYAKRFLEVLKMKDIEVHLVVSKVAEKIIQYELNLTRESFEKLAKYSYSEDDVDAPLASGSFKIDGMVIIPCSMKTIAGIVSGYTDNLILRTADVTLKEKRRLILVPRETPLNVIHLRNMLELAKLGVVILPAMPAFYHKPEKIEDLVDFIVGKILDLLEIDHDLFKRWST
ncbi:MAG: UbiX family flavin prenyltransferase [Aigarchaeota archaeon]|nr:UbiX family flavin prenyltransferase [Aigarchaeota archaeon]MCX8192425.1 UbiX family flavin prenyltransferase [Nitrososphaeria archaeon]MDW7986631.1 UbiX family flavin prenyltransferase [Nitrososphaerota archaeon]